jgi:hypothetical protein
MLKLRSLFIIFFAVSLWSCAPYKVKTVEFIERHPSNFNLPKDQTLRKEGLNHWLYSIIPRHHSQIRFFDIVHWTMWSLLGNNDDGLFGEEETGKYKTRRKIGVGRAIAWGLRNPLHNFCFYTIGTAYWKNPQFTILALAKEKKLFMHYEPNEETAFAGKGTSLYIGLHGWKPFISVRVYYGRLFESYAGWRSRGNFGLKLILAKKSPFRDNILLKEGE